MILLKNEVVFGEIYLNSFFRPSFLSTDFQYMLVARLQQALHGDRLSLRAHY